MRLTVPMEIRTFADFWPYYVRAHSQPRTRLLHAIGSVLAIISIGLAFAVKDKASIGLLGLLLVCFGFALVG